MAFTLVNNGLSRTDFIGKCALKSPWAVSSHVPIPTELTISQICFNFLFSFFVGSPPVVWCAILGLLWRDLCCVDYCVLASGENLCL